MSSSRSSVRAPSASVRPAESSDSGKLISAAAFHLKGDGWYVTDFRDKGKGKDESSGKQDSAESSTDSKSDSKSSESTSADSKSTDSKSTDSKSTDSKGGSGSKSSSGASDSPRAA